MGKTVVNNKRKQQSKEELVVMAFMLISFGIRFLYCIQKEFACSMHDLGTSIANGSAWYQDGHIGYLQYIYQYGRLPEGDPRELWSYYNPPFYYVVAALFLKINSLFGLDMKHMLENLQLLTMLFATLAIQTGDRIIRACNIKGRARVAAVAVLAFHPYFIIGGAALNNDILSILFIFLTILYTIQWYQNSSIKGILKIALTIGLGMMTKLSVGLIAIPVAMLFLVKFIKAGEYKKYIGQFALFGLVCIPLGMYWSVRNAILYGMPLVYVQALGENSPQFVGTDLLRRLNLWDIKHLLDPYIRMNPKIDYNVWTNLFKTAVFDEQAVPLTDALPVFVSRVLLYSSMAVGILALYMGIAAERNEKSKDPWIKVFCWAIYLLFMGSYLKFCFQFPMICSMNFRYVVPAALIGAIHIGRYYQKEGASRYIRWAMGICLTIFAVSSSLLYGALGF